MKSVQTRSSRPSWAPLLIVALLSSTAAFGATKSGPSEAQLRYQQERAACLTGQTNQDRTTCLREAAAALAEARRGELEGSKAEQLNNQLRRCEPLPAADRQACIARMSGQGTTSGSVAAGGIYRELVTIEPAEPPRR
ncbi:MAG: hypothetical protein V4792_12300 [Pseudomonadota bacterium]